MQAKSYVSLPNCCQETAQTSLACKQIHFTGKFNRFLKKKVFTQNLCHILCNQVYAQEQSSYPVVHTFSPNLKE